MLLIDSKVLLDRTALKVVRVEKDLLGNSEVLLVFTATGAKQIKYITSEYSGRRLAILFNGKLHSAPTIVTPIADGIVRITELTQEQAQAIAENLRLKKDE